MYEIWLVLNIVYEIALGIWPILLGFFLLWLGLMLVARKKFSWCALRPAIFSGAIIAVVMFFSTPSLTQSSLVNMGYWVDWANLLAIALGFGILVVFFAYPLAALFCPRCKLKNSH